MMEWEKSVEIAIEKYCDLCSISLKLFFKDLCRSEACVVIDVNRCLI